MDCLLFDCSYLWFEHLYKYATAERFVSDEEEDSQDSNSDSSWIGFTQYYREITSNYKKGASQGKGAHHQLHSYNTQPSMNKQE